MSVAPQVSELNGTERAVFGPRTAAEVAALLDRYLVGLGTRTAEVLFRSGRIDAVWALRTEDGRELVVKAHRPPVDLTARAATSAAQRVLVAAGFPCPAPISGPDSLAGLTVSVETLTSAGGVADGRRPEVRRSIAAGLAEHIDLLRPVSGLTSRAGRGPAWCRYQDGPWPVPHDTIFDFRVLPAGYEWLDRLARMAADRLLDLVGACETVVGHADWYCGNLRFDGDRLAASFDWDLVAGPESFIVGLTAAAYAGGGATGADMSSPADAAAFLADYDALRPRRFDRTERQIAAAAVAWVLAFNARCELSLFGGASPGGSALDLTRRHGTEYLQLTW